MAPGVPLVEPPPPPPPPRRAGPIVWTISTHTHGIVDYAAVVWLAVTPRIFAFGDTSTMASLDVAMVMLVLAALTQYPLGLLRAIPLGLHLLVDYALGSLLVLAPRMFGLSPQDPGGPMLQTAGVMLLGVTLVTQAGTSFVSRRRTRAPILA